MSSTVNPTKMALEHQKIGSFKLVQRRFVEMDRRCDDRKVSITCFHPTEPVIVCGFNQVILLSAADRCVPLSEWKQKKIKFEFNSLLQIGSLRWNMNGSRLAAGCNEGSVYVWAYPSAEILYKVEEHTDWIETLFWSPFKEHLFASCHILLDNVMIWNSLCSDTKRPCGILGEVCVVEWVSTDKIAIGFANGLIEIRQIDEIESNLTSKIIKQYKQESARVTGLCMNNITQYLASCYQNGWIKIWSKESIEPTYSLKTDSECSAIAWRPSVKTPGVRITVARKALENFTLACGLEDGSILIWNVLEKDKAKMQISLSIAGISQSYKFFTFSPDGQFLAVVYHDPAFIHECNTFIFSTDNWIPIFRCHCQNILGGHMSWMPTDLSEGAAYKLAISSCNNQINVIEAVAVQAGRYKKS